MSLNENSVWCLGLPCTVHCLRVRGLSPAHVSVTVIPFNVFSFYIRSILPWLFRSNDVLDRWHSLKSRFHFSYPCILSVSAYHSVHCQRVRGAITYIICHKCNFCHICHNCHIVGSFFGVYTLYPSCNSGLVRQTTHSLTCVCVSVSRTEGK